MPRLLACSAIAAALFATPAIAQTAAAPSPAPSPAPRSFLWTRFALGFGTSVLAHEGGHIAAAYLLNARPSFGLDRGRPTVYSGISADDEPRKQFVFSSAGLTVQMLLDEAILDVPHHGGGTFERGVLAGGIGTVLFYATAGRNASVSDITYMARTSSLSKTQVSLIYGAVAGLHTIRIARDGTYAHFFVAPQADGRLRVGMRIAPEP